MGVENKEDDHPRGNFRGTSATVTLATTLSLIAVILVIALVYFYARYHLRLDRRRRQQNFLRRVNNQIANLDVNSTRSPNSGLDPLVIASLPRLLYKETNHFSQVQSGLDHLATTEVQPTAPPVEDVSHVDVSRETEKVSCSGLRIASFPRMVIGMERSLRRSYDDSAAVEDIENQ
ncbi:unnamed protein product [Lupinus luteus]|uniref:Uncharacterized protein n=1 Tax=Lupinus luteus TaxID=3873 RepID=A0AAV1YBX3_LUPLU